MAPPFLKSEYDAKRGQDQRPWWNEFGQMRRKKLYLLPQMVDIFKMLAWKQLFLDPAV